MKYESGKLYKTTGHTRSCTVDAKGKLLGQSVEVPEGSVLLLCKKDKLCLYRGDKDKEYYIFLYKQNRVVAYADEHLDSLESLLEEL